MTTYHTGDTIRVAATFRDWAADGTGALVDPDTVNVRVFNSDWSEYSAASPATNESVGVWYYDFIFPDVEANYPYDQTFYIEFEGTKDSLPIVKRIRVRATQVGSS